MAATVRSESEMKQDAKKRLQVTQDPVEKIRLQCLTRGCNGIKGLGKMFRIIDDDGSRKLDFSEFQKGLGDYGIHVSKEESTALFKSLDKDSSGTIDFDEFLMALRILYQQMQQLMLRQIRQYKESSSFMNDFLAHASDSAVTSPLQPPMSAARQKIILEAFRKLDKNNSGIVDINDMKSVYNVKNHPKFLSGECSEEQLFKQFLATFEIGEHVDGLVTKEEFINYYAGVSASIDSDIYFDLMMRSAWKL